MLCALGNTGSKWTDESIRRRAREYLAARPDLAHVLTERVGPFEYFRMHRDFAFEISPPGNGLDCHRHWENIYLGTIPIVFSSPKDDFHRRFPMVIIEDLDEITPENLERWRGDHAPYWDPELRWLTRLYDDAIPWRRTAP